MSTADTTNYVSLSRVTSSSHDQSPLEMDAESFYHLVLKHNKVGNSRRFFLVLNDPNEQ